MQGNISANKVIFSLGGDSIANLLAGGTVNNSTGNAQLCFNGGVGNVTHVSGTQANITDALNTTGFNFSVITLTTTVNPEDSSLLTMCMYQDGELVAQANTKASQSANISNTLSTLYLGSWSNGNSSCDYDLLRLSIHSGAMSAEEVSPYAASFKATAIPEPATATLSLLALAGLAARRRRK